MTYSETDPKPDTITKIIGQIVGEEYFTTKEIKLVLIYNSVLAGMGILNLESLKKIWKVPIIIISEKKPDNQKILAVIENLAQSEEYKQVLEQNPDNWIHMENTRLFMLTLGINEKDAVQLITKFQISGDLPEPLRVADIIAKAIH